MYPHLENLVCFGSSLDTVSLQGNPFWLDVFSSYKEFGRRIEIETKEHLLNEPLFFNDNFKINKSNFFFEHWFLSGIVFVKDLLDNNGSFLSFHELKNKYNLDEPNFLNYYGSVEAVKKKQRSLNILIIDNIVNNTHHLTILTLMSVHKGSHLYYNIFSSNETVHAFSKKWDTKLGIELNWSNIFQQVRYIKEIKLRWFYIRIITRILGTNVSLQAMGLRNDDLCTFCKTSRESILHIFVDCNIVKDFWQEFRRLLLTNNIISQDFNFTQKTILFGLSNLAPDNKIFFYVMILAKFFIYRCKFENTVPVVLNFVHYLGKQHTIWKHIAVKNLCLDKFNEEWDIWFSLLT